jgi:hypothetical protein
MVSQLERLRREIQARDKGFIYITYEKGVEDPLGQVTRIIEGATIGGREVQVLGIETREGGMYGISTPRRSFPFLEGDRDSGEIQINLHQALTYGTQAPNMYNGKYVLPVWLSGEDSSAVETGTLSERSVGHMQIVLIPDGLRRMSEFGIDRDNWVNHERYFGLSELL